MGFSPYRYSLSKWWGIYPLQNSGLCESFGVAGMADVDTLSSIRKPGRVAEFVIVLRISLWNRTAMSTC